MYDVILQEEAIEDMLAAYNWYEEQRNGLGDELMNEIYDCINNLERHPENYTYLNAWYRRIKIHRFPYFFSMKSGAVWLSFICFIMRRKTLRGDSRLPSPYDII